MKAGNSLNYKAFCVAALPLMGTRERCEVEELLLALQSLHCFKLEKKKKR